VNRLPLGSGSAELSAAIPAQRAENCGEHTIDLGQVRAYVIAFFERDELRSRYLARRPPRLVMEVDISGRYVDEARTPASV
jgi:hypothetical protein